MAGTYSANGSGLGAGGYLYARVEATVVDTSATTCTVTVNAIVVSAGGSSSFISGRATCNASDGYGSWSGNKSVSTNSRTTLKTETFTVAREYSAKSITCRANLAGGGTGMYAGTKDTATCTASIPAIPVSAPNAPSSCTATRNSDAKATITWTNGSTDATHPRTAVLIERQVNGGSWSQIASLGASVATYADTTITENRVYAYRVRSQNSAGTSAYSTSGNMYTTPAAPTAVTLTKKSATTVSIAATVSAPYATGYDIQRSVAGGSWASVATNVGLPRTDTVNGGSVKYRVRSVRGALASAWKESSSITMITAPNAPTSASATRNSDSKATVTWTNGATTDEKPRTATLIERQDGDSSPWVQVASQGATATSYADSAIAANTRYRYRVRAQNGVGYSSYATSGYIYTTPAAPTAVALSKTSATAVKITVTVSAPYATAFDIQKSENGGSWVAVASGASLPYTDTTSAASVKYRVRSTRGTLASAWKESAAIMGIVAPDAPTITSRPASSVVSGSTTAIAWAPSHPDGTAQTKAQVKVTDPSGTEMVYDISGATTTFSFAPSALGMWSAQVRTYGLASSWGAWSTSVSWRMADVPIITIDAPSVDGAEIDALPMDVVWDVEDVSGIGSQTVALVRENTVLLSLDMEVGARSTTLSMSDYTFENNVEYSVRVTVINGYGLASTSTRTFRTAWVPPADPVLEIAYTEGCAVSLVVCDGQGEIPAESFELQRVQADGSIWTIATGLDSGGSAIDPLPPLNEPVRYVAVAYAQTGASAFSEVEAAVHTASWLFNFGSSAEEVLELAYNPNANYTLDHGGETYHFADGGEGGGLPVWYGTTDRDENGSLSFDTVDQHDSDRLRILSKANPVGWVRDPFGHRWRARIKPNSSHGVGRNWAIGIDWQAMRFREAW